LSRYVQSHKKKEGNLERRERERDMGLGMLRGRKKKGSFYVYKEKMWEKISKTCVMFLVWFELERGFIIVWLSKLFCQCFHWV